MQTLPQVVEEIKKQQATITHSVEHQLNYTKELDESVRQNTRDITLLARILILQFNDIVKLNGTAKEVETSYRIDLNLWQMLIKRLGSWNFSVYNWNKNL
jgi:hypothetical protein